MSVSRTRASARTTPTALSLFPAAKVSRACFSPSVASASKYGMPGPIGVRRATTRAGRYQRLQPLPLKRHPALRDPQQPCAVLVRIERVLAAEIDSRSLPLCRQKKASEGQRSSHESRPRSSAIRCSPAFALTTRNRVFGSTSTDPIFPTLICAREATSVSIHSPDAIDPIPATCFAATSGAPSSRTTSHRAPASRGIRQ